MKRVEAAFDTASDAFTEAEQALDAAREQRAQARRHGTRPGRRTNVLPRHVLGADAVEVRVATVTPVSAGWPGAGGGKLS
jgi:hypothetical protein